MQKGRKLGLLLGAAAMAGIGVSGQVMSGVADKTVEHQTNVPQSSSDSGAESYKAARERRNSRLAIAMNQLTGGLDFPPANRFGIMTPKEYGQIFGRRSKGGKTNRLRLAHNAKVARRRAA